MFTNDCLDALVREREHRLRADARAERDRGSAPARRALAASLRQFADRLDGGAVARSGEPALK